ncbi:MAG TPA: branched-chain amino acid ABC transporter permease [Clostridiales bacterium]|jgi:branched-chain amino acid transport system permease protein|nr:branched-chain amino acid ABC transporter permease [Clostridiales bacterium]
MRLRDNHLFRLIIFVILPLIGLIVTSMNSGSYYSGLVHLFGINIILVASLNLVNGYSGMFSMGHAAFMAIGAYASAMLTLTADQKVFLMPALPDWLMHLTLPFPVTLLVAGVLASVTALLIGFPVLRFKGHYLSVATIGLIVIVRAVLDNEDQITNGARGVTGLPDYASTGIIFSVAILCLFVLYRLIHSSYGRGLIAMRDDWTAAQTLGVNLTTKKLSAFLISAFMAGMAGGLWGHMQSVISGKFFYIDTSFKIVETSIIGGMFSLSGAIVGSALMTFIPELLAPLETGITLFGVQLPELYGASNMILAAALILIIIFRRQGIMGYSEIITDSLFSRETYLSLFRPDQYSSLAKAIVTLPVRSWQSLKARWVGQKHKSL